MTSLHTDEDALRARLAARFAAALTLRNDELPHDITERLRFAREQALVRAREVRRVQDAPVVVSVQAGVATQAGPSWWQRLGVVLPLLLLLVGLAAIREHSTREQLLAAADIDTVLLSDALPPAAYTDPGFAEFLKAPQP